MTNQTNAHRGTCGHCGEPVHYHSTPSMGLWVHDTSGPCDRTLTERQHVIREHPRPAAEDLRSPSRRLVREAEIVIGPGNAADVVIGALGLDDGIDSPEPGVWRLILIPIGD